MKTSLAIFLALAVSLAFGCVDATIQLAGDEDSELEDEGLLAPLKTEFDEGMHKHLLRSTPPATPRRAIESNETVPPPPPPRPPRMFGKIFTKPFKSTQIVVQRCISPDMQGCTPNEPSVPGGKVRHLLVKGDDGDTWMHFEEEATVSTEVVSEEEEEVIHEIESNPQEDVEGPVAANAAEDAVAPSPPGDDSDVAKQTSGTVTGPQDKVVNELPPSLQAWTYQGTVSIDGVTYHNYTTTYDTMVKLGGSNGNAAEVEETKALIEAGLIADFHEYLEDDAGSPYRLREYSTPNEWKLYRETVFLAVEPLSDAQVEDYKEKQAKEEGESLRRKLSRKRTSTKMATELFSLRGTAPKTHHSLPEKEADLTGGRDQPTLEEEEEMLKAAKDLSTERQLRQPGIMTGIELPRGCLNSNSLAPCFALHTFVTRNRVSTRLRFTVGAKKNVKTRAVGKVKRQVGLVLDGKLVTDWKGRLLNFDASALGCAEYAKSIGILSVGVEFCMQGSVKKSKYWLRGRLDMWASVFATVWGKRFSYKVAGGSVEVHAFDYDKYMPWANLGYRLTSIEGKIWRKVYFGIAFVGAGITTKSRPRDIINTDNWQTDVYFNAFGGIDLWFWKPKVNIDIKIAQIGPERRKAVSGAPNGLLTASDKREINRNNRRVLTESEQLEDAKEAVACDPQCIVESTPGEYVSFRLPGGKADDVISFPPFRYVGDAPDRWLVDEAISLKNNCTWADEFLDPDDCPSTRCEGFAWTEIEYTCVFNGDIDNPGAAWKRSGDFQKMDGSFFERITSKEDCYNDVSQYSAGQDTVANGAEFVKFGLATWDTNDQSLERLVACAEIPANAKHIKLTNIEYIAAKDPYVRAVSVSQEDIGSAVAVDESSSCLKPFGITCCTGNHKLTSNPITAWEETTITTNLDGAADINIISPQDTTFIFSTGDEIDFDSDLDLSVADFAIGTSFVDGPYDTQSGSGHVRQWDLDGMAENGVYEQTTHKNQYTNLAISYHELVYDYYWKAHAELVWEKQGKSVHFGELQGRVAGRQFFPKSHQLETTTCFWCNSTDSICGLYKDQITPTSD